ncbi:hypothetical protein OIU79_028033 [Salix purpurea]|uniref:Uncharacterized protein n=1 Tax=Salix purpurea TaxID=77065 RepID=A0A9Q0VVL2_SALPP|nr:hypothetical protein OIU79_028033 [Salix purpurea]
MAMKSHAPLAIIAFTLVIFLYGKRSFALHAGAQSVTFSFTNKCPYTVGQGTTTNAGGRHYLQRSFTLAAGCFIFAGAQQHGLAATGPKRNALQMHRESLFVLLLAVPPVSLNAMERCDPTGFLGENLLRR